MKEWARTFYLSQAWKNCRAAYIKQAGGLCERCLAKGLIVPGEIVHHRVHLTPANVTNPDVTLNPQHLELVCRNCHSEIHGRIEKRYRFDEFGRCIIAPLSKD